MGRAGETMDIHEELRRNRIVFEKGMGKEPEPVAAMAKGQGTPRRLPPRRRRRGAGWPVENAQLVRHIRCKRRSREIRREKSVRSARTFCLESSRKKAAKTCKQGR